MKMFLRESKILLIILILSMSCDEGPLGLVCDNSMDPNCPNYESPLAQILSPPSPIEGDTIATNYVSFLWSGVQSSSDFQYKLSGLNDSWSAWDSITNISYDNLSDETTYTFYVKEKYSTGDDQQTPTSCTFTIDSVDPLATIDIGPDEGDTIITNHVTFSWFGVRANSDFQYKLEGVDADWSTWGDIKNITYNYLDEESFIFYVRERYDSGDEQNQISSRSFNVNAVTGPALVMKKQLVQVENNNSFTIEIMAEEVSDIMGILINIVFDENILEVSSIEQGNFFGADNPDGITFITNSVTEVNENGRIEINSSRLGGELTGMSGTGIIGEIKFVVKSMTSATEILFDTGEACQMRDANNDNIFINDRIGTRVELSE